MTDHMITRAPRLQPRSVRRAAALFAVACVAIAFAACGGDATVTDDGGQLPTQTSSPADSGPTVNDPEGDARVAQDGDQVQVHYTGTLDNGEVFDSSEGRDPLPFTVGAGDVIAGFDDAVRGLAVGDSIRVRIEPDQAYGQRRDDLVIELPLAGAPDGLQVGDRVRLQNGAPAVVLEIGDESVRIDANHQLAGEALTFDIELVSVE